MGKFKFILFFIGLCLLIGCASATVTGDSPNSTSTTNILKNTTWIGETITTQDLYLKNTTSRVQLNIIDSNVIIDGAWHLSGTDCNIGADISIINSTLVFNSSDIVGDHSGQVVNCTWFEGTTKGTLDRSRFIRLGDVTNETRYSSLTIQNSTISGKEYENNAWGIDVRTAGEGAGYGRRAHKIIVQDSNFSYLGGSYNGIAYYALGMHYLDLPIGSPIMEGSVLDNITFYECNRGIGMPNIGDVSTLTNVKSVGGGNVVNCGTIFYGHHLDRSIEPIGQFSDGFVFRDNWVNASDTKFNLDRPNGTSYNNTLIRCQVNLGDGANTPGNGLFYNNTLINSGAGTRRGNLTLRDNTLSYSANSGHSYILSPGGYDCRLINNTITANKTGNTLTGFYIVPHDLTLDSPYAVNGRLPNNTVSDNRISGTRYTFYVDKQHNLTLKNNTITDLQSGYGTHFILKNSTDVKIIDSDLTDPNANLYDLYLDSNPDEILLINSIADRVRFSTDTIKNYKYLDVKTESGGVAVSGSIIEINQSSKNINGIDDTDFVTGATGRTPLPIDPSNSGCILDYTQNNTAKTDSSFSLTASATGHTSVTLDNIDPDSNWYRTNPSNSKYTIVVDFNESANTHITGFAPSQDLNAYKEGDPIKFQIWTSEPCDTISWKVNGTEVATDTTTYETTVGDEEVIVDISGTDDNGAFSKTWDITPTTNLPNPDFTADPITGDFPLAVSFTDDTTDEPTYWKWDFDNDGVIDSTQQNPTYKYKAKGNYTVKLIAGNSGGEQSISKSAYIQVTGTNPRKIKVFSFLLEWLNSFYRQYIADFGA
jgi:parallel beta-helix repeat protein